MSEAAKEEMYDRGIAPLLKEAAEKATTAGIPLLCLAEWNEGKIGMTRSGFTSDSASLEFIFPLLAHQSAPNLDGFVLGIIRYCREKNIDMSASIVADRFVKQRRIG